MLGLDDDDNDDDVVGRIEAMMLVWGDRLSWGARRHGDAMACFFIRGHESGRAGWWWWCSATASTAAGVAGVACHF